MNCRCRLFTWPGQMPVYVFNSSVEALLSCSRTCKDLIMYSTDADSLWLLVSNFDIFSRYLDSRRWSVSSVFEISPTLRWFLSMALVDRLTLERKHVCACGYWAIPPRIVLLSSLIECCCAAEWWWMVENQMCVCFGWFLNFWPEYGCFKSFSQIAHLLICCQVLFWFVLLYCSRFILLADLLTSRTVHLS